MASSPDRFYSLSSSLNKTTDNGYGGVMEWDVAADAALHSGATPCFDGIAPFVPPAGTTSSTATPTTTSVPTTSTLGLTSVGSKADTGSSNSMHGERITVGSKPEQVQRISAYVGAVDSAPYNQYSLAIYTDAGGAPGTLVAQSGIGTLHGKSWHSMPLSASLQANTAYWLVYNSNGRSSSVNNLRCNSVTNKVGVHPTTSQPFGSWPASYGSGSEGTWRDSLYLTAGP